VSQVLLIARDAAVRDQLQNVIRQAGVSADVVGDFGPALAQLEKEPPVLVLAEDPPSDDVMENLQKALRSHAPVTPLLVFLGALDSGRAVKRMGQGAFDCLCPPLSPGDFLSAAKRAVSRCGRRLLVSRPAGRAASWRHAAAFVAAGVVLFLALLGVGLYGVFSPPFHIYKLATEHPAAVAGDDDGLWVADWAQQSLTHLRVKSGYMSIVQVHKFADFQPVSVVAAPYYIYTASADGRLRRHRRDDKLTVTASLPAPGPAVAGLAWDGDSLWSVDADTGKIYEHDARLGVKRASASPVAKPAGLAWWKDHLWVADAQTRRLWKLTPQGSEWKKTGPYELSIFDHNRHIQMTNFTLWGNNLWFVSEGDGILVRHRVPRES
jgi:CheY-like chemotaxis protein